MDTERICARIDLDAILWNMEKMHERLKPETNMMAVIKTDGYGHGAVPIAQALRGLPYVYGFAVATVDEAMELRQAGIQNPILVLGVTFPSSYEQMIFGDICPAIVSYDMAESYSKACVKAGKTINVHIKLDTGMGRIGFAPGKKTVSQILSIEQLPGLHIQGIFTHFARADERDKSQIEKQISCLEDTLQALKENGFEPDIVHAANSAAILEYPKAQYDMVRAGVTLYGLWPSEEMNRDFPLRPALSLKSHVSFVKEVPENTPISYGGTFVTKRNSRIATVPVGYGDGYSRGLSGKGYVLIHGEKAPILGRVCMDQFMVDVTDFSRPVQVFDEVTLVGTDGENTITLEELGELSGRFNYEFACDLGNRIPRLYYRNGKLTDTKAYFDEIES